MTPQKSHHIPENVFQMLLELCQAWHCDHFPEEPVPVPRHPLGENPFCDIQSKPPLTQVHSISLSPITGHESEEIVPVSPTFGVLTEYA